MTKINKKTSPSKATQKKVNNKVSILQIQDQTNRDMLMALLVVSIGINVLVLVSWIVLKKSTIEPSTLSFMLGI